MHAKQESEFPRSSHDTGTDAITQSSLEGIGRMVTTDTLYLVFPVWVWLASEVIIKHGLRQETAKSPTTNLSLPRLTYRDHA